MGYSQYKKPVGKSWQKAKQLRCIFTANSGSGSGCARDSSETVTPAQFCHTPPAVPPSAPQAGLRLLWLPFLPSRRVALRRLASHRSLALIFPFVLAFKNALPCVPMRAFGWQPGESERATEGEGEREGSEGESKTVAWYLAPAWLGQMQKALNSMDTIDPEAAADAAAAAVAVLAAASNDVVVVVDCCCCCSCHHCCCLLLLLLFSLLLSVFRLSHLNLLNYICYVGGNL